MLSRREQQQVVDRLRQQPPQQHQQKIYDGSSAAASLANIGDAPNALVDHQPVLRHQQPPATAASSRPLRARQGSLLRPGSTPNPQQQRDTSPAPFQPEPPATAPSPSQQQQQQQQALVAAHNGTSDSNSNYLPLGKKKANAADRIRSRDMASTAALKSGDPLMSAYVALPASNHESLVKLFMDSDVPEEAERLQQIVVPGELFAAAEIRAEQAEARFTDTFAKLQHAERENLHREQELTELKAEVSRAHADVNKYQNENVHLLEQSRVDRAQVLEMKQALEKIKFAKVEVEKQRDAAEAYVVQLQQKNVSVMAQSARLQADYEMAVKSGGASSAFLNSTRSPRMMGNGGTSSFFTSSAAGMAPTAAESGGDQDAAAPKTPRTSDGFDVPASEIIPPAGDAAPASSSPPDGPTITSTGVFDPRPAPSSDAEGDQQQQQQQSGAEGIMSPVQLQLHMLEHQRSNSVTTSGSAAAAAAAAAASAGPDSAEARLARKTRELAKLRLRIFVREVSSSRQIKAIKAMADEAQAELESYKRRFVRRVSMHQSAFASSTADGKKQKLFGAAQEDEDEEDEAAGTLQHSRTATHATVEAEIPESPRWAVRHSAGGDDDKNDPSTTSSSAAAGGAAAASSRRSESLRPCRSQRCRTLKHALRDRLAIFEQDMMSRFDVDAHRLAQKQQQQQQQQRRGGGAPPPPLGSFSSSRPRQSDLVTSSSSVGMFVQDTALPTDDNASSLRPPDPLEQTANESTTTASAAAAAVAGVGADAEVDHSFSASSSSPQGLDALKGAGNSRSVLGQLVSHLEECTRFVLSLGSEAMPEAHHAGRTLHSNKMLFAASTAIVDGAASFLASAETAVAALGALEGLLFSSKTLPEARVKWAGMRDRAQYADTLGVHIDTGAVAMRDSIVELRCFQKREHASGSFLLDGGSRRLNRSAGGGSFRSLSSRGTAGDGEDEEEEEEESDGGFTEGTNSGAESAQEEDESVVDFRTFKLAHNIFNVLREFELEIGRQKANGVPVRAAWALATNADKDDADPNAKILAARKEAQEIYSNSPSGMYRLMHDAAAKLRLVVPVVVNCMRVYNSWEGVKMESRDADRSLLNPKEAAMLAKMNGGGSGAAGAEQAGAEEDGGDAAAPAVATPIADAKLKQLKREQQQFTERIKTAEDYRNALLSKAHPRWKMLLGRLMTFSKKQLGGFKAAQQGGAWRTDKAKAREAEKERQQRERVSQRHHQQGGNFTERSKMQFKAAAAGRYVVPSDQRSGNVFSRLHGAPTGRSRTSLPEVVRRLYPNSRAARSRSEGNDPSSSSSSPHDGSGGSPLLRQQHGSLYGSMRRERRRGAEERLQQDRGPEAAMRRWLERRRQVISGYRYDAGPKPQQQDDQPEQQQPQQQQQPRPTAETPIPPHRSSPQQQKHRHITSPQQQGLHATDDTSSKTNKHQHLEFNLPANIDAESRALLENKHVISQVSSLLRTQLREEQERTDRMRSEVLSLRKELDAAALQAQNAAREEHIAVRLREQLQQEQDNTANAKRELGQAKDEVAHLRHELEKMRKQMVTVMNNRAIGRASSFQISSGGSGEEHNRVSPTPSAGANNEIGSHKITSSSSSSHHQPHSHSNHQLQRYASTPNIVVAQKIFDAGVPFVNVDDADERDVIRTEGSGGGVARKASVAFGSTARLAQTQQDVVLGATPPRRSPERRFSYTTGSGSSNHVVPHGSAAVPLGQQRKSFSSSSSSPNLGAATSGPTPPATARVTKTMDINSMIVGNSFSRPSQPPLPQQQVESAPQPIEQPSTSPRAAQLQTQGFNDTFAGAKPPPPPPPPVDPVVVPTPPASMSAQQQQHESNHWESTMPASTASQQQHHAGISGVRIGGQPQQQQQQPRPPPPPPAASQQQQQPGNQRTARAERIARDPRWQNNFNSWMSRRRAW